MNHCVDRHDAELLEVGMTFTVEPMLTTGAPEFTQAADGWTESLDDDMASAQFEHTVVVTEPGVEILTVTESGATAVGRMPDFGSGR